MEKPKEEKKTQHQTLTAFHLPGPGPRELLWLSRRPRDAGGRCHSQPPHAEDRTPMKIPRTCFQA